MRTYVVWCPDLGQEQEDGATVPATDPADARTLADAIVADLGTSLAGLETESDDTRARAVTLLINDYAELLAALNFVGRHEAKAEQETRKPLRAVVLQAGKAKSPAGTPSAPVDPA